MGTTLEQLLTWMQAIREDEHLEFKAAKETFGWDDLGKYCSALANERGGRLILGVSNPRPRRVVGSQAFRNTQNAKSFLHRELGLRVDVDELQHPAGRVVVFRVPPRLLGTPVAYKGAYYMRVGESLAPMTPERLKAILDEAVTDFSALTAAEASLDDLAPRAIARFRQLWARKSGNESLNTVPDEQLLADAELLVNGKPNYAALILMGTREALSRHLAQAELIFEYRSADSTIGHAQRKSYREGFFLWGDDLWGTINARNDIQHYQDGLFVWDIPTFSEGPVREAVLNAVAHRDYRLPDSVLVRQFPRRLEVVSPGGLPPGITPENILWKQSWRNRRIAETLEKCGLVERSGQGIDRMFVECIRHSKPLPDFRHTDSHQVYLTLYGHVQDPRFLRFLEKMGQERWASFSLEDLLVLDRLRQDQPVPAELKERLPALADNGVIETVGRGRGTRYILSRRFYAFLGKRGVYTRKRGLDRSTNKALIEEHLVRNRAEGSAMHELLDVLPALTRAQVQSLLRELRREDRAHVIGRTRGARWYPGPTQ